MVTVSYKKGQFWGRFSRAIKGAFASLISTKGLQKPFDGVQRLNVTNYSVKLGTFRAILGMSVQCALKW